MKTIVMAHGAFCGGWAFDAFRAPFETAGWRVLAPDLRAGAGASMADYAADLVGLCASLEAPPVLLGHSMGGLAAQLAARGARLQALVLLAPSAPWGVAGSSFEEAASAMTVQFLDPFGGGAVEADRGAMAAYALDRLDQDDRARILDRLRPESGLAMRQALSWWLDPFMTTSIGPGALPVQALAVAGEHDRVHPPATVRQIAGRIGAAFHLAPGMSHWLMDGPGAEALAQTVLAWLASDVRAAA